MENKKQSKISLKIQIKPQKQSKIALIPSKKGLGLLERKKGKEKR